MHHVTRRLAVALAGTAAAAVIINRPDELGWFDADGRPVLKVERFDFHALLT
jgi:hypothetical protein